MASEYFGIDLGGVISDIEQDSSTNSTDIELAVDLTNSPTREQVIVALQNIRDYLLQIDWPPA